MQKNLPKPNNWEEFEDICLALWKKIWNDQHAQKYSTNQQGQKGIDIDGFPNGGTNRHAIQCKANTKTNKLNQKEVEENIKTASEEQNPAIKELIIATTADRNPNDQDFIRKLSIEYQNKCNLRIVLYSWNEIEEKLHEHPELVGKFYREFFISLITLGSTIFLAHINNELEQNDSKNYQPVINIYRNLISQITLITKAPSEESEEKSSSILLNEIRNCLNSSQVSNAFEKLNVFKEIYYSEVDNDEKFRYHYYLGDAYNEINELQLCSENFLLAFENNPKRITANKLKSLALLIKGNLIDAGDYALKAIKDDPCDEVAYQVLEQAFPDKSYEEIISTIPVDKREEPNVAFAIAEIARRKNKLDLSLEWMDKAILKPQENYKLKLHLSLILFELGITKSHLSFLGSSNIEANNFLKKAIVLSNEVLNEIKFDKKLLEAKSYIFINRANAFRILGNYEEAKKEFDYYFETFNTIDNDAIKIRALLAVQMNEPEIAEKYLKQIFHPSSPIDIKIILSDVLRLQEKYTEGISILKEEIQMNPSRSGEINRALLNLYIDNKQYETALDFIETALQENFNILNIVGKAFLEIRMGKTESALQTLSSAEQLITEETEIKEKIDLALILYQAQQYKRSANILVKINPSLSDSFLTEKLVYSLHLSGDDYQALEICQKLRTNFGIIPYAAAIEIYIYEKVGDYQSAVEICSEILKHSPTDFSVNLKKTYFFTI